MIGKYLDLSTAHLTTKTLETLYDSSYDIVSYPKYDVDMNETFGAFIHIPDDLNDYNLPDDLLAVLNYAKKAGCYWVQIDRDAEIIPELKTY